MDVVDSGSLGREPLAELARATHKQSTRKRSREALKPVGAIPTGARPDTPEAVMVLALELV